MRSAGYRGGVSTAIVPRWRLALTAVALVGGLFALHGLTHHGEHVPSVTTPAHAEGGHGSSAPAGGSQHEGSGAMTLCVAMVLGAAVLWLVGAARRRLSRPWRLPRLSTFAVVRAPVRGRAHGPPNRWVLSVCRC